jgi:hypothetical protein
LDLGTEQCVPFRARAMHAWATKHVAKPVTTAFARMTDNENSHNEM